MLRPASAEFVALCRSQISLLTQALGASLSAVYLTEELAQNHQAELVPIAVYPEETELWPPMGALPLPTSRNLTPQLLLEQPLGAKAEVGPLESVADETTVPRAALALMRQQRLVLPLIHENLVLGFLVVDRTDAPWTGAERSQLEEVAHTLAIACVLDQRYQWLEHTTYHQGLQHEHHLALQAQQHDILANLLHQLRNPLTALRTLGKLLLKRIVPGEANRELVLSMVRESDRMEQLLQQFDAAIDLGAAMLDSEQIDVPATATPSSLPLLPGAGLTAGGLQLQPCWLADVLEPLLTSAAAIASDRQLDFQVEIPPDLPPVRADVRALQEVCSNLMDNALKYAPSGSKIWLQVRPAAAHRSGQRTQAMIVSDTGPGIPPQDRERVFERHYRGIQAEGNIAGTGLGLAIARDLIEQMQGQIQVFSPALDREALGQSPEAGPGSSFVVTLPEIAPTHLE